MTKNRIIFSVAWTPEEMEKIRALHQTSSYSYMSLGAFIRFLVISALNDLKNQVKES